MTQLTHKQLMLNEISASRVLQLELIIKARAEAENLRIASFPTQAFLHLWIVTEVAAKELMCIYKYTKNTHSVINKVQLELKRAVQPHLNIVSMEQANRSAEDVADKALPSLIAPFHSIFKSGAGVACRQLDIGVINSCLEALDLTVDHARLGYLLGTKDNPLPDGVILSSKITIRERRNKLVHTNGQVDDATLAQLLPVFDYFFSLLQQLTTQFAVSQQLNLDNEVAE